MTDFEIAKKNLTGHTISLCKNGKCLYSDLRGISSMMNFIDENTDLSGYCVADTVVGKAVALLFVKCGIVGVYAKTLSKSAQAVLKSHGITYEYEVLTERIVNREGTDTCPMEKTVIGTEDAEEGYELLKAKLAEMRTHK